MEQQTNKYSGAESVNYWTKFYEMYESKDEHALAHLMMYILETCKTDEDFNHVESFLRQKPTDAKNSLLLNFISQIRLK